ncbi:MAG: flavoprotein [Rhizobiales bacterium 24-66-13]|jgi:hypothetical protein|nr:MAG: flavoprotein [Rhizobiales bacterium 35-66-30]OYZ78337.1 MAG: flavoprotein [Rhizobiales bacterium 24-66-13]OZB07227.1 MAG: flavoprotein [Rhizobiales bacterium 39-66-18]HQS07339.1 NAD(P)-binding protein [Xanthobacteraceae bacterium]HQS45447.1 NAD(P)-binding protein [Xanthobacteraceae bacterium]
MTKQSIEDLPIAVIGGGPIGLAAAAHLASRNVPVKVYEAGTSVASNIRDWGHIRVFTPWRYCVDSAATTLLEKHGWRMPPEDDIPTGLEIVTRYLEPLAATPELSGVIEIGARVTAISRLGIDKVVSQGRENRPFVLVVETSNGVRRDLARAVIDVSGTWTTPNPLGASGLPADGEAQNADSIAYGIPDVLGRDRTAYAGRTTLVVGAGHSAANVLLDLARLAEAEPSTSLLWATRGTNLARVYGGGDADELASRGDLGRRLRELVETGRTTLTPGFSILRLRKEADRLVAEGETADGPMALGPIDRIIVTTGQRPDLALTRELRLELDPWLESVKALGPLIDPNKHSCGSVPPHGYRELSHPEPGFYTAGIKSYGRAPTFLLLTGYEQVRSIAAALAGDFAAAQNVQLVIPETGVCSLQVDDSVAPSGCCDTPPAKKAAPCCAGAAADQVVERIGEH